MLGDKPRKAARRLNLSPEPPSDRERQANANVFGRLLGQPSSVPPDPLPEKYPVQIRDRVQKKDPVQDEDWLPDRDPVQSVAATAVVPATKQVPGGMAETARGFLKIPNDVVDRVLPTLEPTEAIIYLRLYRLSHGFGQKTCRVSLPTLAERCKCHVNTARRSLRALRNAGLIRDQGMTNTGYSDGGTHYEILLGAGDSSADVPTTKKKGVQKKYPVAQRDRVPEM